MVGTGPPGGRMRARAKARAPAAREARSYPSHHKKHRRIDACFIVAIFPLPYAHNFRPSAAGVNVICGRSQGWCGLHGLAGGGGAGGPGRLPHFSKLRQGVSRPASTALPSAPPPHHLGTTGPVVSISPSSRATL